MARRTMTHTPHISSDWLKSMGAIEDWMVKIGRPVSPPVTHLENGSFLWIARMTAIPHEVQDDRVLAAKFDNASENIAKLGRDFAGKLSMHAYLSRRRVCFKQSYRFEARWVQHFCDDYLERFVSEEYFENSYHLALVLKYDDFDDGLKQIEALGKQVFLDFSDYQPEVLETFNRQHINGTMMQFSPVYSFIGDLINGVTTDMPVFAEPGYEAIPSSRLHFGDDTLEIRGPGVPASRRFAICHDLRTFPDDVSWGQLNPLLTEPVEFTITQSFDCVSSYAANRLITSKINKLKSAGDKAHHQVAEMENAQGYVNANQLTFGDYHGAMIVYGETPQKASANGELMVSRSNNGCRVGWMRATASAPYTYFSQVPGAKVKPRPKPQGSVAIMVGGRA
jgi:type IV secretion system protein VirB4